MRHLCGHGRRALVLLVLFAFFSSTANSGVWVPNEKNLAVEMRADLSDESGKDVRQDVSPLQLTRYNALIDYSDVLVVRNLNSPISMEIADYFIQQRNVPPTNVCNVSTSASEVIDRTTFNNLMTQVMDNMTAHGLLNKINIIVTTKGVPLKINDSPFTDRRASVDSELALINGIHAGKIGNLWWMVNPYFNSTERHSHQDDQMYVVTRLTGYTVEDATSLIDRATRSIGKKGRFVLDVDPRKDGSAGYKDGNDWMRIAYDILTSRGFEVFIDQNNTFVNNQSGLAGYASWGSNDGNWYIPENTNTGFETDGDGDMIPDGWFKTDNPGLSEVIMSDEDPQRDDWAVKMNRSQVNENYTAISQNFSVIPERRYVLIGAANLTNVSGDKGVHLQIKSYKADNTLIGIFNGSARSGTTSDYVGLGQVVYEPEPNATKLVVSAILSKSNGLVFLDNIRLIEIKPHNTWIDGAVGETYVSTGGRSFRYPTAYGQSLVADIIKDGISGVKGYVYEPYLTAVAHPNILYERYTKGWALGESFLAASQVGLSWMDVILGDPKVAPYNLSFIPDLAIEVDNFTVSNRRIMTGTSVSLEAIVENRGNFPTVNATISFYLGQPGSGGIPIMNLTETLDHHDSIKVNLTWIAYGPPGEYDLCVLADPHDEFYELDEQNNLACYPIRLSEGIYLEEGWNLISLPLEPIDTNITEALRSIDGIYDMIRFYDSNDTTDPWKTYYSSKPPAFSDLASIDRRMGFWIHLHSAATLEVSGSHFRSTVISLVAGWNLIGYPSLKDQRVEDVFFGTPILKIESFSGSASVYHLQELENSSYMAPGNGYWVKVETDCLLRVYG